MYYRHRHRHRRRCRRPHRRRCHRRHRHCCRRRRHRHCCRRRRCHLHRCRNNSDCLKFLQLTKYKKIPDFSFFFLSILSNLLDDEPERCNRVGRAVNWAECCRDSNPGRID